MKASEQITDEHKQKYRHNRIKGKTESFSHNITPNYYSEVILTYNGGVYKTANVKIYKIKNPSSEENGIFGEDEWARTTDPLHVKPA